LASAFRKPGHLKYTDYVGECCTTLAEGNESPGDRLIPHFIRLQRLKEDVNVTFDYDDHEDLPPMDAPRIEGLVKSFNKQLAQLQETIPPEAWNNTALSLTCYNLKIYIHEIGLHAIAPPPMQGISNEQSCRSWFSSMARTDTLLACLEAAKEYLDLYINLGMSEMRGNTIVEEVKVVYAFLVLGKFCSGVNTPHLEPLHLRKSANIEYYMDALVARTDKLIVTVNGIEQRNYFWHFRTLFKYSRVWYQQQIQGDFFTTLQSDGVPDCMDMNLLELVHYGPDGEVITDTGTPSDTDTSWSMGTSKVWAQATPLAIPMPSSTLTVDKTPLQGQVWTGFFDEYPQGVGQPLTNMDFDYMGMDADGMEFMEGM
jgi:hypothetical protein